MEKLSYTVESTQPCSSWSSVGTCLCLIACTERGCQIGDVWPPPLTASFTVSMNSRESGFSEELLWYQKKKKKSRSVYVEGSHGFWQRGEGEYRLLDCSPSHARNVSMTATFSRAQFSHQWTERPGLAHQRFLQVKRTWWSPVLSPANLRQNPEEQPSNSQWPLNQGSEKISHRNDHAKSCLLPEPRVIGTGKRRGISLSQRLKARKHTGFCSEEVSVSTDPGKSRKPAHNHSQFPFHLPGLILESAQDSWS